MAKRSEREAKGQRRRLTLLIAAAVCLMLVAAGIAALLALQSRGFIGPIATPSLPVASPAGSRMPGVGQMGTPPPSPPSTDRQPFYGMQYVPIDQIGLVQGLGVEVILMDFPHDGPAEDWLDYLDTADEYGVKVVAWLWPPGWEWDGTAWQIDEQARVFIRTVADHPALLAVYSLHEPYWMGCDRCGYTTVEQQMLYDKIKAIADVPIWSAVDGPAYWTAQGEKTAFADGICDYCEMWFYPFKGRERYERDALIERMVADIQTARTRAPHSKIVWDMQSFAIGAPYHLRMPTGPEMRDLASVVYSMDIDGALWYTWTWNDSYSDYLVNHSELYPTVREIYDQIVHP
jgi:hypothetical protein